MKFDLAARRPQGEAENKCVAVASPLSCFREDHNPFHPSSSLCFVNHIVTDCWRFSMTIKNESSFITLFFYALDPVLLTVMADNLEAIHADKFFIGLWLIIICFLVLTYFSSAGVVMILCSGVTFLSNPTRCALCNATTGRHRAGEDGLPPLGRDLGYWLIMLPLLPLSSACGRLALQCESSERRLCY